MFTFRDMVSLTFFKNFSCPNLNCHVTAMTYTKSLT